MTLLSKNSGSKDFKTFGNIKRILYIEKEARKKNIKKNKRSRSGVVAAASNGSKG